MLCDLEVEILTLERTGYLSGSCLLIYVKPHGNESAACCFSDLLKLLALLALIAKGDNVANLNSVRRDINSLAVHTEMTVRYELTSLTTGGCHAHSENDVVKTGFQKPDKVFTGNAFLFGSMFIVVTELLFENAVNKLPLLLFLKLGAVLGNLLASVAAGVSLGFLIFGIAQYRGTDVQRSALLQNRIAINCHYNYPPLFDQISVCQPTPSKRPLGSFHL